MANNPFGKPAEDDGKIVIPGADDVDKNKWWAPPGRYAATCIGCARGVTNGGDPKVVLTFTLNKPLKVDKPDPKAVGKEMTDHCSLSPAALWATMPKLEALGVDPAKAATEGFSPKDVEGKKCEIVIEDNEYEGQVNSRVKKVFPPTSGGKGKK